MTIGGFMMFWIVFLLLFSNLQAVCYFTNIDANCNDEGEAFQVDAKTTARIGHIVQLSFPGTNKELKRDYSLTNPETRAVKDDVVAIIDSISWQGGANDNIRILGRVSPQNKAILQEVFSSMTDNVDMEVAFVIYEYDYTAEKYFKRLHTFNKPVKLVIAPESKVYIEEDPNNYKMKKPVNFTFQIEFMPKSGVADQKLGFAFSSSGTQFSRQLEGKAASSASDN